MTDAKDKRINLFNLNSRRNVTYIWPSISLFTTYDSSSLRRGYKVFMNSPLADPEILYKNESKLLNKVLTLEELKEERHKYEMRSSQYKEPDKVKARNDWHALIQSTLETGSPYFIHKLRVWFPKSRLVKWLMTKMLNFSSREWKNTIYNILTGYGCYRPPAEITVPAKHYFNPYVKNMVTHVPPFLKNKAVEYDDGVPASVPQMAYDLTEFLVFLKHGRRPDLKVEALS
eukprot:TRINITY_DN4013_c0_g1_i1.p1 TRINITY_DN4013_c0_g1~~TRINITY_DN4013_c0_g1_i1.p1  ORF type:complete len:230 (-),score=63.30 TRINITY_DN4013_c0_g1_i1:340-1029(-)